MRVCKRRKGAEGERKRIHAEHRAPRGAESHNPGVMTWTEIKSWMLNHLSHSGTPLFVCLFVFVFIQKHLSFYLSIYLSIYLSLVWWILVYFFIFVTFLSNTFNLFISFWFNFSSFLIYISLKSLSVVLICSCFPSHLVFTSKQSFSCISNFFCHFDFWPFQLLT